MTLNTWCSKTDFYMQKNETTYVPICLSPYTKNQIKTDQKTRYKNRNTETTGR